MGHEPIFGNSRPRAGWFRAIRTDEAFELCKLNPVAFMVLYLIASRTRFKPGLEVPMGSAIVDWKVLGITEQQFRTAKSQLEKLGLATFKSTTRGTLGKLTDSRVFESLNSSNNGLINGQPTDSKAKTQRTDPDFPTDKSTDSKHEETSTESTIFDGSSVNANGLNNGQLPDFQRTDSEKSTTKKESINRKNIRRRETLAPSWDDFWAYCQSIGLTAEPYARDKFEAANSENWKRMPNWQAYARRVKGWWSADGRPASPSSRGPAKVQVQPDHSKGFFT
jgi:hypothetical protein